MLQSVTFVSSGLFCVNFSIQIFSILSNVSLISLFIVLIGLTISPIINSWEISCNIALINKFLTSKLNNLYLGADYDIAKNKNTIKKIVNQYNMNNMNISYQ